ncbi:MAG: LysM peptidoglycan-binding domain-containing protein, partial [Vicinamibacterales bacterium]
VVTDQVADLIAASNRHFEAGSRELQLGHLETARNEFNRSLEVLLESGYGARSEPRIRDHFDRLVERISAYEISALAQGDGFTEKPYEPASLDDLLAVATFPQPDATPETTRAVVDDLQETRHDIDIPLNARVLNFVELFTGRLKNYLEEGLSRGARFLPMIQEVFRAEGIPLDLAYVPLVESAFKPNALSKAKAKGLWQFMRGTALENGLKHDWYIDERTDPEKATRAAAKYLKTLYGMFGDWHLALASYNGGPGRVQRAMKRSSRDDFWTLSTGTKYLPRETRDYVPLILAAVIIAKNPAQYGMNVLPGPVQAFETVTVPTATDIRRIAEWAGAPVQAIQDLNPELRRWTTPVRGNDYALRVPEGTAASVTAALSGSDPGELAPLNWHAVKKGETLSTIARKLKVSRSDLAEANYLTLKSKVSIGQRLIIPRAPALLLATRTDSPAPVAESRSLDAVAAANVRGPRLEKADQAKTLYRVKRGDTLYSIARFFDTTVASLRTWNGIRGSAIQIGQRLTIFSSRGNNTQ